MSKERCSGAYLMRVHIVVSLQRCYRRLSFSRPVLMWALLKAPNINTILILPSFRRHFWQCWEALQWFAAPKMGEYPSLKVCLPGCTSSHPTSSFMKETPSITNSGQSWHVPDHPNIIETIDKLVVSLDVENHQEAFFCGTLYLPWKTVHWTGKLSKASAQERVLLSRTRQGGVIEWFQHFTTLLRGPHPPNGHQAWEMSPGRPAGFDHH